MDQNNNQKKSEEKAQGLTSKVIVGSFWTLVGQVLPLAVSFLVIPIIIRLFGTERFGLYSFVNSFSSYFPFNDLGMSLASTRFASEAYSENSEKKESETVQTAAVIGFISSTIFAIALFFGAPIIVNQGLNIPENLRFEAIIAICLTAFITIARVLSNVFNTPQLVRLRMDLNSLVNTSVVILQTLSIPVILYFGGGIVEVFSAILIYSILNVLGHLFVSGKLLNGLYSFSIDKKLLRPLLVFGGTIVLSSIAATLLVNAEKIVLTRYASVTAFAHYSVAFTLANMVVVFSSAMVQSLVPAFARLHSANKIEEIKSLYSRIIRVNLIVIAPIAMFLCVIAKTFFTLWAGEEFGRESTLPFYILMGGLVFNVVAYIPHSLLNAAKLTKVIALLYWFELFPYILLAGFLTYNFGAVGAALAWSLRVFVDAMFFIYLAKKKVNKDLSIFELRKTETLCSFVCLLPPLLSLFVFDNFYFPFILAVVCFFCYALLAWKKVLLSEEKIWFMEKTKFFSFSKNRK